ncbi:MoaD/ThiS family protein [Chitinophaga deserti]|uniref:MoaD/ThiS family protein n=1 Tax=Chitinophaga deserti TaxID=2164099 RepID=UPI000D6B05B8|nr:MoaD/ThiS family protein [Chitinophaga deserti]
MKVKLTAFGALTDILDKHSELEATDTDELLKVLKARFPALTTQKILVAVNQQIVKNNIPLNDNDEVALMPPYSGG